MDVARPKQKNTRRTLSIIGGVIALVVVTVALMRLKPAAPTIDPGFWPDSVRRGEMVREVRGPGTLVPEHVRQVVSQVSGRVDRLFVLGGETVTPETVLLEMSNPDAQITALGAEQAYYQARSDLTNLRTTNATNQLNQEAAVAGANTVYVKAKQDLEAADSISKTGSGFVSRFDVNNFRAAAEEATTRLRVARQQLDLMKQTADSQVAAQAAQVERLHTVATFQDEKLKTLVVRAGDAGVVQDVSLETGQWITEGTTLAKVVQPGKLKAVLRIPESQAKDVQVGQGASIDTRNGIVAGHVSRKDPSSQTGTITVDVALDGPLPAGAVPDLSVDGTITIEKLHDVMYMGRPAYGAGTGTVGIFKIVEDGKYAVRVQVELGRSSVNTVEVIKGLAVGDHVILSDMSQWDSYDRVKLK